MLIVCMMQKFALPISMFSRIDSDLKHFFFERWFNTHGKEYELDNSLVLSMPGLHPLDHLLLDRSPNIGPLISRWELDKFNTG
jgi:hypothetical protein